MRKAQGLPMNVIIVAILLLIALVVLGTMFYRGSLKFGQSTSSCTEKGGTCEASAVACQNKEGVVSPQLRCEDTKKVCCIS